MNNILSLINPARIIKVEDAMKVAQIEMPIGDVMYNDTERKARAYDLLQGLESLYALKLEKGHFVCPPRPPQTEWELSEVEASAQIDIALVYVKESEKVLFEGFEEHSTSEVVHKETLTRIDFQKEFTFITLRSNGGTICIKHATVEDLFTEIKRRNKAVATATPIELEYTSNIFSLLKIEG